MENIEFFDKYISGELSQKEKGEFDERLRTDKDFATEFRIYATAVIGICREAEQDNKDFGEAMKRITKEELLSIIGEPTKPDKTPRLKKWLLWQGIGIAALLGLGVIYLVIAVHQEPLKEPIRENALAMSQEAQNRVDDAIYALSDYSQGVARSGGIDISSLSDDELRIQLPEIEANFREQTDDLDIAEYGSELVMAFIRLHERDKAKKLLEELISRFQNNGDYAGDVTNWQTILSLLK